MAGFDFAGVAGGHDQPPRTKGLALLFRLDFRTNPESFLVLADLEAFGFGFCFGRFFAGFFCSIILRFFGIRSHAERQNRSAAARQ